MWGGVHREGFVLHTSSVPLSVLPMAGSMMIT